jgi:hypothetical protein
MAANTPRASKPEPGSIGEFVSEFTPVLQDFSGLAQGSSTHNAASSSPQPDTLVTIPRELAERCLSSMRAAVTFGETRRGRPPAQTCMYEIEELEAILRGPAKSAEASTKRKTLICPQCGVDRLESPCPTMSEKCAKVADAHLLATQR